jgi:hypothetical protein
MNLRAVPDRGCRSRPPVSARGPGVIGSDVLIEIPGTLSWSLSLS